MSDFPPGTSSDSTVSGTAATPVDVTVTLRDSDSLDRVAAGLDRDDSLVVDRVAEPEAALDAIDSTDCLVTDGEAGPTVLSAVQSADAVVPTVLFTAAPVEPLLDGITAAWVDVVRPGGDDAIALLAHRITSVADHRRASERATQLAVAAEAATDGIALVDATDAIVFANGQFARQFGYQQGALAGRDWRMLFAADAVGRIEADALTAVADGWQWIGTLEGRRADGSPVPLRTRVTDAGDGGIVIAVFQQADRTSA